MLMSPSTPNQSSALATSRLKKAFRQIVLPAGFVVSLILVSVPIKPTFPAPGIDPAWEYAMNQAVAQRMVFGRDVVFTFGPYACAYTGQYHPGTSSLMMISILICVIGTALGLLTLSRGRLTWSLAAFSAASALVPLHDAFFLLMPLVFFLICFRLVLPPEDKLSVAPTPATQVSVVALTLGLSVLPLIKGTFALMTGVLGLLGWILLVRRRRRAAIVVAAIFLFGIIGYWLAANQPLWALPIFFLGQLPVMSGYSEAMSLESAPLAISWFLCSAVVIISLAVFALRSKGANWGLFAIALIAFVFVVFKAAFVRAHGFIATDSLLLLSLVLSTQIKRVSGAMIVVIGCFGWLAFAKEYHKFNIIDVRSYLERSQMYGNLVQGWRMWSGGTLRESFQHALAVITAETRVNSSESVDIYPYRQDILLANHLNWRPRPVLQSYSAYKPELAQLNAQHLLGPSAPRCVLFDVSPIDNRLATLEDAPSWPILLTRYRLSGLNGRFLILNRDAKASEVRDEELSQGTQRLGKFFTLPALEQPIWARIDIRPTILGRLMNILFKLPALEIELRTESGDVEKFRYVASMGQSGFLISPIIHDPVDVCALLTSYRKTYFERALPTQVRIVGGRETRIFWSRHFNVELFRLDIPAQPEANGLLQGEFPDQLGKNGDLRDRIIVGRAECALDAVDMKAVTTASIAARRPLLVQGWAAASPNKGWGADEIYVGISDLSGHKLRSVRAQLNPRPDVCEAFKQPNLGPVGFNATVDLRGLKGTYEMVIYVKWQGRLFLANRTLELVN